MSVIRTFSIQSGSNGNCIYVEAGDTRLLFDAGVAGRTARGRMAIHDRRPQDVDAMIISHEHADHIRCAGVFQRLFRTPMYITRPTFDAIRMNLGPLGEVRFFRAGDTLQIKDVRVHTYSTPHDAVDSVIFVVEHDGRRLGIFTDLGHSFPGLVELLESVDAAYLESNYDRMMLAGGPYPDYLKLRISGDGGHVANDESAALVKRAAARRHRWIALSHLSEQNNSPELALAEHQKTVGRDFPFEVSSRTEVSVMREV
jgi:phosphoribosyl 1,2-cyclic phosphodiesterase